MKKQISLFLSLSLLCVSGAHAVRKNNNRSYKDAVITTKSVLQQMRAEGLVPSVLPATAAAIYQEEQVSVVGTQEIPTPAVITDVVPAVTIESPVANDEQSACGPQEMSVAEAQDIPAAVQQKAAPSYWFSDKTSDSWHGADVNLLHALKTGEFDKDRWPKERFESAIAAIMTPVLAQEREANRLKGRVLGIQNPKLVELIAVLAKAQEVGQLPESAAKIHQQLTVLQQEEQALIDRVLEELMARLYLVKQARTLTRTATDENESDDEQYSTLRKQFSKLGRRYGKAKIDCKFDQLSSLAATFEGGSEPK